MGKRAQSGKTSREKPEASLEFFDRALTLREKLKRTQAEVIQQPPTYAPTGSLVVA
jgi:hypothetical protein